MSENIPAHHARLILSPELHLDVPVDVTGRQLFNSMAKCLGAAVIPSPFPERYSCVVAFDEAHWFQLECATGPLCALAAWKRCVNAGEPVSVTIAVHRRCMHGAPMVPFHGYVCGWC